MAQLATSAVSLRIGGEFLQPDEVTRLLGGGPSKQWKKGDLFRSASAGRQRVAKAGHWILSAVDCSPENFDAQVKDLLSQLSSDLDVWKRLRQQFHIDLFCGAFMDKSGEGFSLSAETLYALGARGIEFTLCIYAPIREWRPEELCPCGSLKAYGDCCAPQGECGV